jgi:hypothetical protein
MKVFYPALITSSIFFGAIVVNLHERNYGSIIFISLLAIPALILQVLLTQKGFDILGYLLILVPIILVYVGYSLGIQKKNETFIEETKQINIIPERIEPKMT